MSARDYRVSTIAILCTDCGNDVGNYPGLHVCPPRPAMPMPAIPSKYQQQSPAPSSYSNRSNAPASRMRPPDLNADALQKGNSYASSSSGGGNSYGGSSRTPTSSSFASGSKTPTGLSFQERMKERDRERQQREREEREAALRGLREGKNRSQDQKKLDRIFTDLTKKYECTKTLTGAYVFSHLLFYGPSL